MVSVHEDWTAAQRANGHQVSSLSAPDRDRLHRSKTPYNYYMNGLDLPQEVDKMVNRLKCADLLDERLYPFMHLVENVSTIRFLSESIPSFSHYI